MLKNKNKKTNRKATFRLNLVLAFAFVAIFFFHMVVANHAVTQRYEISQYLEELNALQLSNQKLSIDAVELQSSQRLAQESRRLNLVKADSVRYITPKGSVALGN
jgi:cell division protein FtsB